MKNVCKFKNPLLFISILLVACLLSCSKKEEEYKRIYPSSYFIKFFNGNVYSPVHLKELWDVVKIYEQNPYIKRIETINISTVNDNDTIVVYCANCR